MTRFPKARPTKVAKTARPLRSVTTHVFVFGPHTDMAGELICETCGNLRSHRIHDLTLPEGTVEVQNRMIGETD